MVNYWASGQKADTGESTLRRVETLQGFLGVQNYCNTTSFRFAEKRFVNQCPFEGTGARFSRRGMFERLNPCYTSDFL